LNRKLGIHTWTVHTIDITVDDHDKMAAIDNVPTSSHQEDEEDIDYTEIEER
jgi:hypothetical protein